MLLSRLVLSHQIWRNVPLSDETWSDRAVNSRVEIPHGPWFRDDWVRVGGWDAGRVFDGRQNLQRGVARDFLNGGGERRARDGGLLRTIADREQMGRVAWEEFLGRGGVRRLLCRSAGGNVLVGGLPA